MPAEEQGVNFDRYMLVPRTLVFVFAGEQVMLIRGAASKRLWPNRYNGIGGHIERGETVLAAARREFYEETGLIAPPLELCGIVTIDTGRNPGVGLNILRGEYPDRVEVYREQPATEGKVEWVPWVEVQRYPLVPDLETILPRVIAFRSGSPIFTALYQYDQNGELQIQFDEE